MDLAWLLIRCEFVDRIHFDGPVFIKGVAEETGYPSLWIEIGTSDYVRQESRLLGHGEQESKAEMEKLCLSFIREFGVPKYPPFLSGDTGLTSKPDHYDQDLSEAREWLRNNVYLVEGAEAGQGAPASPEVQDDILKRLRESTEL